MRALRSGGRAGWSDTRAGGVMGGIVLLVAEASEADQFYPPAGRSKMQICAWRMLVDRLMARGIMMDKRSAWFPDREAPNRGGYPLCGYQCSVMAELTGRAGLSDLFSAVKGQGIGPNATIRSGRGDPVPYQCPTYTGPGVRGGFCADLSVAFHGWTGRVALLEKRLPQDTIFRMREWKYLVSDQYICQRRWN